MATESSVLAVIRASRPSFRNPHDKLAFAVHATFLAAGYSLIAVGRSAFADNPPTAGDEVGIDGWNDLEDAYGFVYSKTDKGLKKSVLVKCLAVGDVLAVDVLNLEEQQKEPFDLQISVKDHVVDGAGGTGNYGEMYWNLKDMVEKLNSGVLEKLEPKAEASSSASRFPISSSPKKGTLGSIKAEPGKWSAVRMQRTSLRFPISSSPKKGTLGSIKAEPGKWSAVRMQRSKSLFKNLVVRPDHSSIDESAERLPYEHQQPPSGLVYPPIPSFGGNRDLYPGPGAGFYPDRGSGFGGDMLVGPNDPRWFGSDERAGFPGGIPSVPPGARFDPFGPPGVPGFEPNRFIRQPRRPGGDVHPDLEHFRDPDYI